MTKRREPSPSGRKSGARGKSHDGTKLNRIGPAGASTRKGVNPGGTNEAADHMVQGASHQGSSLGKRSSG